MLKPKQNKNEREKAVKRTIIEPELVPRKKKRHTEGAFISRKEDNLPIKKRFLIVCEGPTEAAYFEGLCKIFETHSVFTITILPDKNDLDNAEGYQGSSVKGLLYLAMKKQKNAIMPYDDVWIVTDNDEENAYKLDDNSLNKIKELVPKHIYERLQSFQINEMNVRESERFKKEHLRKRYFLSLLDYENFLKTVILDAKDLFYLPIIIQSTTKKYDFTDLYSGNSEVFFYDINGDFITTNNRGEEKFEKKYFDKNWTNYINVAYSCISFEYWLLLHFEENTDSFYNSREIIKYFDYKDHFKNLFEKGWYLYEEIESPIVKDFFYKAQQAIQNNIWMNTIIHSQIKAGKHFYEVNPYSDVFCLVSLLLNQQNTRIAYLNEPISHFDLKDICVAQSENTITITFIFDRKQSILASNIQSLFSFVDEKHSPIDVNIDIENKGIIQKGDSVKLRIIFTNKRVFLIYLGLKEQIKSEIYTLLWLLN